MVKVEPLLPDNISLFVCSPCFPGLSHCCHITIIPPFVTQLRMSFPYTCKSHKSHMCTSVIGREDDILNKLAPNLSQ